MAERLDDYRQCFNWAEQAVYNVLSGHVNRGPDTEHLLTALSVGHYIMGNQAEADQVSTTPLMQENPEARFILFTSLARAGDSSAIPKARQAMSRASEESTYLDDVVPGLDFGGIRSAEKLAKLVSVGDKELVDIARKAAATVAIKHRSTKFTDLYCAGDQQSLALALEAAKAAYEEDSLTGYAHNASIATTNLHTILDHALKNAAFGDASVVTTQFKEEWDVTEALAKRFAAGEQSVLPELEERIPTKGHIRRRCIMHLARANYQPAVEEIRSHAAEVEKSLSKAWWQRLTKPAPDDADREQLYEDLTILHNLGEGTAIDRAIELAKTDQEFSRSYGFGDEGEGTLELAKIAYDKNPGVLSRLRLLELSFEPELFKEQLLDEIGRLQKSRSSWLAELIILTAQKAASSSTAH